MKKSIRILAVMALFLAVVGIARTNPAWADAFTSPPKSAPQSGQDLVDSNAAQPVSIIVTGSGSFLIGGICKFDANLTATDIVDRVDAEVPIAISKLVHFTGKGELYYPGCRVVHYKNDKIVDLTDEQDGNWKVCFGERPDLSLTIYYYKYLDTPPNGSEVWVPLPTTVEGAYSCAPALHTGVYMPAGNIIKAPGGYETIKGIRIVPPPIGSVQPPPYTNVITSSGLYGMGGICNLDVLYKENDLMDNLWVETTIQDTSTVTISDNEHLLFLPGCHVLHYEESQVQEYVGNEKGIWTICFAALPDKQTTIFFYKSLAHQDIPEKIIPPWIPLTTTIKDGLACAPAEYTGVYAPASK